MSAAYYIDPQLEIPGFDHFVNGKRVASAGEDLIDSICTELGVKPLFEFVSHERRELDDSWSADDDDEGGAASVWFDASEGVTTVEALIEYIEDEEHDLDDADDLMEDLLEYRYVLKRLAKDQVGWCLRLDF